MYTPKTEMYYATGRNVSRIRQKCITPKTELKKQNDNRSSKLRTESGTTKLGSNR